MELIDRCGISNSVGGSVYVSFKENAQKLIKQSIAAQSSTRSSIGGDGGGMSRVNSRIIHEIDNINEYTNSIIGSTSRGPVTTVAAGGGGNGNMKVSDLLSPRRSPLKSPVKSPMRSTSGGGGGGSDGDAIISYQTSLSTLTKGFKLVLEKIIRAASISIESKLESTSLRKRLTEANMRLENHKREMGALKIAYEASHSSSSSGGGDGDGNDSAALRLALEETIEMLEAQNITTLNLENQLEIVSNEVGGKVSQMKMLYSREQALGKYLYKVLSSSMECIDTYLTTTNNSKNDIEKLVKLKSLYLPSPHSTILDYVRFVDKMITSLMYSVSIVSYDYNSGIDMSLSENLFTTNNNDGSGSGGGNDYSSFVPTQYNTSNSNSISRSQPQQQQQQQQQQLYSSSQSISSTVSDITTQQTYSTQYTKKPPTIYPPVPTTKSSKKLPLKKKPVIRSLHEEEEIVESPNRVRVDNYTDSVRQETDSQLSGSSSVLQSRLNKARTQLQAAHIKASSQSDIVTSINSNNDNDDSGGSGDNKSGKVENKKKVVKKAYSDNESDGTFDIDQEEDDKSFDIDGDGGDSDSF